VFRGGAPLSAVVATAARGQLDAARVTQELGALVDKSILTASFPDDGGRYDLLDTVREYAVEQLAKAGSLSAAQLAHADYFATVADAARVELRGPDWLDCIGRLELEHDNLWAALTYARDAPDPAIAVRLGAGLGWYFALAERVSEGRSFLEAALAATSTSEQAPIQRRMELLAWLCFLATEELDLDAAVQTGQHALALAAAAPASSEAALVRVVLALALAHSGDLEPAAALAEAARAGYRAASDDWGITLSTLVRGSVAAGAGDVATAATMIAQGRRQAEAIGYGAFQPPALLFEAWVAEQRNDREAAAAAYRRAVEVSGGIGFRDHASVALSGLGAIAFARGDLDQAQALFRQALATAEADPTSWPVAHARVRLAGILEAAGDTDTAQRLYHSVVDWSETPRPHRSRETQFVAFNGSPGAAALSGLARLAAARGDHTIAQELQARAATVAARDGAPPHTLQTAATTT
jgi:ATP/maltotriose-dependent transcriptional regulator MalT